MKIKQNLSALWLLPAGPKSRVLVDSAKRTRYDFQSVKCETRGVFGTDVKSLSCVIKAARIPVWTARPRHVLLLLLLL